MTQIRNANDLFKEHSASDHYYQHSFGFVLTDGVMALATSFECFWLIDVIVSYQYGLKRHEFQVWTLTVADNGTAIVCCTDGNDKVLRKQRIPFTDFKAEACTLWLEGNVILLPSEH